MVIDLHTHSTASDGTLTPADLVRRAADGGLDVIALTDHDTTSGWDEAAAALPDGLSLVRGAEISCRHGDISLHLLGYLFDPSHEPLSTGLRRLRDSRTDRADRMLDKLRADGHHIGVRAEGTVGRPHIGAGLVEAGLVSSLDEAFTREWIGTGGRYWVGKEELDVLEAIQLVRDAGGVTVFAHPFAHARGRTVGPEAVEELAAAGLDGIEVDHPDHTDEARDQLRELAGALGLVVTGSSDFHGTNKETALGANVTDGSAYQDLVGRATGVGVL